MRENGLQNRLPRIKEAFVIEVKIKNGDSLSLNIKGHAEFDDIGKDVICAAATTLAYTFAQIVEDNTFNMRRQPISELKKGDVYIECMPAGKIRKMIKTSLDTITVGYKLLEYNFPEYLKVYIG